MFFFFFANCTHRWSPYSRARVNKKKEQLNWTGTTIIRTKIPGKSNEKSKSPRFLRNTREIFTERHCAGYAEIPTAKDHKTRECTTDFRGPEDEFSQIFRRESHGATRAEVTGGTFRLRAGYLVKSFRLPTTFSHAYDEHFSTRITIGVPDVLDRWNVKTPNVANA